MKYPIGIQDFRKIREQGYVYVDKTQHICNFIGNGNYFFLSRPRRFGKSLLCSTLNELYSDSQALFQGLWIEKHWDFEAQKRPVIWLRFASQGMRSLGILKGIHHMLDSEAARLGVVLEQEDYSLKFKELIQKTAKEKQVVLLIDEYDKPIIDYLDDVPEAEKNRDVLKGFYSVLKNSDPHIELLFMTGVSAFSMVSIFSDLNNLKNLSLHPLTNSLLGITHEEVSHYFTEVLAKTAIQENKTLDDLQSELAQWYNGYSWDGKTRVYNPFPLLSYLDSGQFNNYWFSTGTPTFLVKEMKKQGLFNISNIQTVSSDLSNFDFVHLNPITVLFQTGYLTVKEYDPEVFLYTLDYPNKEVRHSLEQLLMNDYMSRPVHGALPRVVNIMKALRQKDLDTVIEIINAAFAGIPYEHWQKENEHFYHALVHLIFSLLNTYLRSESHTARGRCDALVETADHIYAFEFKLDKTAEEALQQIYDRGYLEPYADSEKERIAVGINFSTEKKQVEGYLWEELPQKGLKTPH